ncbi:MAG: CbiX/SirB N-terminal domain-containing protein [Gammaproteobacteria bacterium]|nr:CbiX/SirB N-terminal domain-containing protein [Gammaproteobacteria bacterium]
MMSNGLLLFCHGARDSRWREPFDALVERVASRHDGPVTLAFLELMSPNLEEACCSLAAAGASSITVVPIFLGTGDHLRRDLPPLLDLAQAAAGVSVTTIDAVGEDETVIAAIGDYCLRAGTGG